MFIRGSQTLSCFDAQHSGTSRRVPAEVDEKSQKRRQAYFHSVFASRAGCDEKKGGPANNRLEPRNVLTLNLKEGRKRDLADRYRCSDRSELEWKSVCIRFTLFTIFLYQLASHLLRKLCASDIETRVTPVSSHPSLPEPSLNRSSCSQRSIR